MGDNQATDLRDWVADIKNKNKKIENQSQLMHPERTN